MLHYLKEYSKWLEITGYRNIAFAKVEEFLKTNRKETKQTTDIQFFDAELIATQEHLYFAALNALQAFQNKTNLSKSTAMEIMLYASAQRQIQKAIQQSGIKPQTTSMAVVIIGENQTQIQTLLESVTACVGTDPDERVLEMTKSKENKIKEAYQITDEEIRTTMENNEQKKAIVNLVIERLALLSTQL
jgi:tRNA threonylcarbamoyladenosine modification (KEOPS) complex Cgi121 subunit